MKKVRIKTWAAMSKEFGVTKNGDIDSFVLFVPSMEDAMPTNRVIEVFEDIDGMHWKTPNETFRIDPDMIDERQIISDEENTLNHTRQAIKNNKDLDLIARINPLLSLDLNLFLSKNDVQVLLLDAIDKKILGLQNEDTKLAVRTYVHNMILEATGNETLATAILARSFDDLYFELGESKDFYTSIYKLANLEMSDNGLVNIG